ncbi:MAG: HipA domain-containing protein [Oscillospiraceae bacterium]|nr:HipA domain-containing protein [Oscillospiraceae bacterium]
MNYTLMHKNIPVADININSFSGTVSKIINTYSIEHLPVSVRCKNGAADLVGLNEWWSSRAIPECRPGLKTALKKLNAKSPKVLLQGSLGLGLADHYWIKPIFSELSWENVNFFDNDFSGDIGDMLFDECRKDEGFDLRSPDIATDGCLKKRWIISEGKRILLKGGEPPYFYQPFNEAIAAAVMARLGIPHVPYSVTWRNGQPYSICENFTSQNSEFIPAWRVMQIRKKPNHISFYTHYVNICREFGIADIVHSLDMMITLDYIIANEDRHFNNFGILRDADTLKWQCAAPIFDSGTSLGCDRPAGSLYEIAECKPFKSRHIEQLKLVTSFDWLEFSKLKGIDEEIFGVMSEHSAISLLGEMRYKDISRFISRRISETQKFALQEARD